MMDVGQALRIASDCYNNGDAINSERLCNQILAVDPINAPALHLHGLIVARQGRATEAFALIGRSLEIDPNNSMAWVHHGIALGNLGKAEQSLLSYEKASIADPSNWHAWINKGVSLHRLGRFVEAIDCYNRALPHYANDPVLHGNLALSYTASGQFGKAIASWDKVLVLSPTNLDAAISRASLLNSLREHSEALKGLDRFRAVGNANPDFLLNLAIALKGVLRLDQALSVCDRVLALGQKLPEAWFARGNILFETGRLDDALACYNKTLELAPLFADAAIGCGSVLAERGDLAGAVAAFDRALALAPDHAQAHWNRGNYLLAHRDFEKGWEEFEWRKRLTGSSEVRIYSKPLWNSREDIKGKTIYLYSEQALGDTIQFCRYVGILRQMGANIILEVQDRLVRLLRDSLDDVEIIGASGTSPRFDYHFPLLSLPRELRTNATNIPDKVPYISAEPDRVRTWAKRLGEHGFKIGICWQGRQSGLTERGRSIPLTCYRPLAQMPGVRLISLQKDKNAGQFLALHGMQVETCGDDFDAGDSAFLDAAAVMENLDLVITCDTAVAHLAGALGRPTWVALRFVPDWRWQLDRSDSPWYPTMRLFRQKNNQDWASVFAEMHVALRELIGAH